MLARKALLDNLLRTLVHEWGYQSVATALASFESDEDGLVGRSAPKVPRNLKVRRKLLATEQVAKAAVPEDKRAALMKLAVRFDRREFLPTTSDVREFLTMLGERTSPMKDRSTAFARVLKSISVLPVERLERYTHSGLHSGPARLGPLSDAISSVALTMVRNRERGS